jgi:hypothetical protein
MSIQIIGNAIWAYPCDLLDGDIDRALDEIARAGLNSISVATAYHTARLLMPHNARRKVVNLESGRVYFRFDPELYVGIPSPRIAGEYEERDPLGEICTAAVRHGLSVQAWTVFLHNSRLAGLHPDMMQINCFGDPYVHALCPSHPAARAYAVALARDIAQHYPIRAIDVEALAFLGYGHNSHHDKASLPLSPLHQFLLSVCFCEHCRQKISEFDVDPQRIAAAFRRELDVWFGGDRRLAAAGERAGLIELIGEEGTTALLCARDQIVMSLIAELRRAVPPTVALQIRTASSPFHAGGKTAGDVRAIAQSGDGLVFSFFGLPLSKFNSEVAAIPWPTLGGKPAWAGIALGMDTPECQNAEEFTERIVLLRTSGFKQFYFYNYGLMPQVCLDWIGALFKENR